MPGSAFFNKSNLDPDARAFLTTASITDPVIRGAINSFVLKLKGDGIWSLIVALYPFVGGNSTAHAYNLKNTGAHLIMFNGTVTHDANGITTDGSTGYGNANLIPSSHLTLNNESLFLYSRTSGQRGSGVDFGGAETTSQRDHMQIRNGSDNALGQLNSATNGAGTITVSNTNGLGFYHVSRISSTDLRYYKNGSSLGKASTTNNGTLFGRRMFIGGRNVTNALNSPVAVNFAMAGAGLGFDSTQASNFYTAVQNLQTALGRQV